MEEGFDNERLEKRTSLVNLRNIEPTKGKRFGKGRVFGGWSHQMRFKRISSRKVEREHPLGGGTRKVKG
jgi:hypothetical protein